VQYLVGALTPPLEAARSSALTTHLSAELLARYSGRWYPQDPERGSAYRALMNFDGPLAKACRLSDIPEDELRQRVQGSRKLGERWTLWIDPGCVSLRQNDGHEYGTIKEVWGRLPHSLPAGTVLVDPPTPTNPLERDIHALPSSQTSPTRLSRAIQIVRPTRRTLSASPLSGPVSLPEDVFAPPPPSSESPPATRCPSQAESSSELLLRPSSRSSSSSSSAHSASSELTAATSIYSSDETTATALSEFKYPAGSASSSATCPKKVASVSPVKRLPPPRRVHTHCLSASSNPNTGEKVQEHLNGKVGVLGGGVLLGLPAGHARSHSASSSTSTSCAGRSRRSRRGGRSINQQWANSAFGQRPLYNYRDDYY
jgi:hypothetical protein